MTMTYHEAVKKLEEMFDQFNAHLFNNEVKKPVIAILPDTTGGAYGWCTTNKIWKSGEEEFYEINICAEYLNRPIKEVCATLIHEMVHLDNIEKGIKDTSGNGRYHNKKFKETAEARGLVIEKMRSHGWTKTSLQEETAVWIDENIKIDKFDLVRGNRRHGFASGSNDGENGKAGDEIGTAKPKAFKYKYYQCPSCGKKFYSIYEIKATCEDCDVTFEQYK